jgi:hypothetical protein
MHIIVFLSILLIGSTGMAGPLNAPLPASGFITLGEQDWAWGGPCPHTGGCGDGDLTHQAAFGWRLPTQAELLGLPQDFALLFRFTGANVPLDGTDLASGAYFNASTGADAACASAYFNSVYTHCDWLDGRAGNWAGLSADPYAEQLYTRRSVVEVAEPLGATLLGVGLITLACLRRRWEDAGLWPPRACLVSDSADMVGHGKHT